MRASVETRRNWMIEDRGDRDTGGPARLHDPLSARANGRFRSGKPSTYRLGVRSVVELGFQGGDPHPRRGPVTWRPSAVLPPVERLHRTLPPRRARSVDFTSHRRGRVSGEYHTSKNSGSGRAGSRRHGGTLPGHYPARYPSAARPGTGLKGHPLDRREQLPRLAVHGTDADCPPSSKTFTQVTEVYSQTIDALIEGRLPPAK